jgi:hypothetical protein
MQWARRRTGLNCRSSLNPFFTAVSKSASGSTMLTNLRRLLCYALDRIGRRLSDDDAGPCRSVNDTMSVSGWPTITWPTSGPVPLRG